MKFTDEEERDIDRWALAITMLIGTPIILILVNLGALPVWRLKMKVGDLIRLGPDYPDYIGVIVRILTEDDTGPLDVEVLIRGKLEKWEADEAEVIA